MGSGISGAAVVYRFADLACPAIARRVKPEAVHKSELHAYFKKSGDWSPDKNLTTDGHLPPPRAVQLKGPQEKEPQKLPYFSASFSITSSRS